MQKYFLNTNDIYANEITIDSGDIDLSIGETKKINVIVSPKESEESGINLQSTNGEVATLATTDNNDIIVKAKSEGTAYIIASAEESGVANFIKVTVK